MSSLRLSPEERWEIWFLFKNDGMSISQISRKICRDYNTVKHWIETYQATEKMDDLPRSGPPRKTSPKDDSYMKARANRDDWEASDIKRGLFNKGGPDISERTIRRRLREGGLLYKSTKQKSPLKPEHFLERARMAKEYKGRKWDRILFTDYSKYELGSRKRFAWTKKGERKFRKNPSHPPKFNFWVSFGRGGPGVLHVFDENLTGDMHYNILKTNVPNAAKKLFKGKWWLLTDNDPKTGTPKMLEKLKNLGFRRLRFSRYSPDLNPSENIINITKNNTAKRNPKTIREAKKFIQEEFQKISPVITSRLVDSMDTRCQAVIDAEGGYTDY